MGERVRIAFVCTGNSCRSRMAEAFAARLLGDRAEVVSAGTHPQAANPLASEVMREIGVPIREGPGRSVAGLEADLFITVCDGAQGACPVLPGRTVHVPFDDPPALARGGGDPLPHYRRVRDEIGVFVENQLRELLSGLKAAPGSTDLKGVPMSSTNAKGDCCAPGCCGGTKAGAKSATKEPATASVQEQVREQVREGYGKIAREGAWLPAASGCCGGGKTAEKKSGGCCGPSTFSPEELARAIGYSSGDLAATPEGANMGLSCGNPTAIAALKAGEVVVDLGSGGGFDCFVAGPKVGATGRVIGVDMTAEMISKARRNIAGYEARSGLSNVEFRLGEIENLPVADGVADVVISNCVLNLSPDKPRAWREIARVLKRGGRAAVSDLALKRPLPREVVDDVEALIGCVAGAVLIDEMRAMIAQAGLTEVTITEKGGYIDAMTDWQDPLYKAVVEKLPKGTRPSDFITSVDVSARKV